jgi:AcrR family transcriptional regulator
LDRTVSGKPPQLHSGEPSPPKPSQKRSIEKRARLLEAGRQIFGQKGYEAASIEEIAGRAGTAAGAFYQYFASKRQFLIVLMSEFLERLASLDLSPPAGGGDLYEFLTAAFRADAEYWGVVRAWQEAALSDPELARMERRIQAWTDARVLRVLEFLARQPGVRQDIDLPGFARMMDRHFWSLLARGPRLTRAEMDREIRLSADVIYHYLFR